MRDGVKRDLAGSWFELSKFDVRCSMFVVRCSLFDVRCSMFPISFWSASSIVYRLSSIGYFRTARFRPWNDFPPGA
jgi:hypothetical protein